MNRKTKTRTKFIDRPLTLRGMALSLLFLVRIQSGSVEAARPPFITPEFAIQEVGNDDELFTIDDGPPPENTRGIFFRRRNRGRISGDDKLETEESPQTLPPPPPTEPTAVQEETDTAQESPVNNDANGNRNEAGTRSAQSDEGSNDESSSGRSVRFPRSVGSLCFEIQASTASSKRKPTARLPPARHIHWRKTDTSSDMPTRTTVKDTDAIEISFDASSAWNLAQLLVNGSATTGLAVLGTLRLLAPMLLARRALIYVLNVGSDWYTGRYLRTTYKKMEHQYFRYYQIPSALRSFGRLSILTIFMMMLGRLMEWVVGLPYPPCRTDQGGCHWWCGFVWMTTVVIMGRTVGTFLATFMGGPLRLEVANERTIKSRNRNDREQVQPHRFLLMRLSNIIHWMLDPDQVIREIVNSATADLKPFHPDPMLFPATWGWLLFLQMIACAREMSRTSGVMHSVMQQVILQQALRDEWYRALILERRVALGAVLIIFYFVATIGVFWTVGTADGLSALLTLPTVCAVMVSTWMNIYFYYERRVTRKRLTAFAGDTGSGSLR